MLTGSIGALEATVEHNWEVEDLAELERAWAKRGAIERSGSPSLTAICGGRMPSRR